MEKSFRLPSRTVCHLKATNKQGLDIFLIDMKSVIVVILSDASFANASGLKIYLGCVMLLAEERQKVNFVHHGSSRCHQARRSVMAAEVHAQFLAFDFGYFIRHAIEQLLKRWIEMEAFVDSCTLFKIVIKNGSTAERHLQTDMMSLKRSNRHGELQKIG